MNNELIFLSFVLVDMLLALLMMKYFSKWGLITFYVIHVIFVQFTIKMQVDLLGYTTLVASMLFAVLFLCTDLISEHYGKKDGYTAVALGAISLILFLFVVNTAMLFTPSESNVISEQFAQLFAGQWRLTLSDLFISYLLFQSFDVWLFHKLKTMTNGKYLWLRNNVSTWISQIILAVAFFQAAFAGVIPQEVLWQLILSGLVMKLFVALLDTPFMYLSYYFLPKKNYIQVIRSQLKAQT